ncbi:MAG: hypothetical protein Q4D57_03335 [Clostridia bacterium]|nr:hypothetical protein [Clostridia bacterium]
MKAWKIFLSAPLMLMLLACLQGNASAADQTVTAGFEEGQEQHVTVNEDVNVDGEINAICVEAHAPENAEDKSASVVVNGNVTFTNEASASAVYVEGRNGNASAEISGDLSATSNGNINGVETWGHSYNGNGEASVTIGGSVTAESRSSNATGIDSDTGSVHVTGDVTAKGVSSAYGVESYSDNDITIGGNVKAEAETPTGMYAYSSTKSNIDVKGSISATGKYSTGLQLFSSEEATSSGGLSVTVENGIRATSTSTEADGRANGISFYNGGGKLMANINGDVEANSASGDAIGIKTDRTDGETGRNFGDGSSKILVHGNVISDGVGVALDTFGENTDVNVLVENEIKAKKVGVAINRTWFADDESETEPKLTVWKINLNDKGNAVEWGNSDFDNVSEDEEEGEQYKAKIIANFEKHIMYIIKVEQPSEGGTIKAVDKDGNALPKSFDFDVAHEGDKVILKANLAKGYKLIAAYNGEGEKVPLLKDKNGNYYIIVPKGGGVYLSVELKDTTKHHQSHNDDDIEFITDNLEAESQKNNDTEPVSIFFTTSGSGSEAPKTGDVSQVAPWIVISLVSVGGIAGLEINNKKNKFKK